jgi:LysM repeat protein
MNSMSETNIIRTLAVSALVVAFIVTMVIITNSGILGSDDGVSGDSLEEEVAPAAAEGEGAVPEAEAPAEAAEPEPAEESEPITLETETYVVEGGDSFFSIATKYDTTIDELLRLNPAVNPQNLMPGTEIAVPRSEAAEE